jgi:hypothetical protein
MVHPALKWLIAAGFVLLVSYFGWQAWQPTAPTATQIPIPMKSGQTAAALSSPSPMQSVTTASSATADSMPSLTAEAEQNPSLSTEQQQAIAFIESAAFSSAAALDAALLHPDGAVAAQTLRHLFTHPDFQSVIDRLAAVEATELSAERQAKLQQKMYDTFGANIHGERFACAGQLCAVTLSSNTALEQNAIDEFGTFDKNYTFINTIKPGNGETVTRLLFIATEDTSNLQVIN